MTSTSNKELFIPLLHVESEHCALIVDKGLAKIDTIEKHRVELNNHRAVIETADPSVAIPAAIKEIRGLGYDVEVKKEEFAVQNMTCASCAISVESMVESLPGVIESSVNYATSRLRVAYLVGVVHPEEMKKVVQSIGYDLLIEEEENEAEHLEAREIEKLKQIKVKAFGAIALATPLFIIGMFFPMMPFADYILWLLSTPLVFWFGASFFRNAWKQLKHGSSNMDTLVALSTGVAYIFSVFNTLMPSFWTSRGLEAHVYFEAAGVVIALILLGKWLEEKAKGSTSQAIKKLMGLQPKEVMRKNKAGEWELVPVRSVQVGDILLVKPGEKISVDGTVVRGQSYVDESMISGEPVAVNKEEGAALLAGTLNQKGSLEFKADKVGNDTLLAHIIKMVQDAQGSKAPIQKSVDKIAGIFVPVVIGIAILTLVCWIIFGGETGLTQGLLAMVTVLVIACPCALGLATPTAIMVGVGKGAENGILIKDAESLERISSITAIVLDKTGTITEGKPEVHELQWEEGAKEFAPVLAALEHQSEHPLAEAVHNYLAIKSTLELDAYQSITGAGVQANYQGETYFIGNKSLIEKELPNAKSSLLATADKWAAEANTTVYFFTSKKLLAIIAIRDKIKVNSIQAIEHIKGLGIKTYMLTGDNKSTAAQVAKEAGIDEFKAEVLPADKAEFVKKLQAAGEVVAMVGDGINDSNALAQADVSIAMGKGSDIAMDVAKMTIIQSDLGKIPIAFAVSRMTRQAIRQNLFWAFIYNLIGIPLAAGVLFPAFGFMLNPMIAGGAMALSSVSVVANSLRLSWKKIG